MDLGAAESGLQGLLIPRHGGRFFAEIDPEPRTGWKAVEQGNIEVLRRHRHRFLLCHELGHTLFYRPGAKLARTAPASERQELFCDELARALLVPPPIAADLPFSPKSVVAIQRRFDVSMQVAIRSMAAAHDGRAWLLLAKDGQNLKVQWTSADRDVTGRTLSKLHTLSKLARQLARTRKDAKSGQFRGRFLVGRGQVIVTAP